MQFNDTSAKTGLIQMCEKESGRGFGAISSDTSELAYFTMKLNEWLHIITQWLHEINDEAVYDDINNTASIPESFSFADNTQRYSLDSDITKIRKVQSHDIDAASKTITITIASPAVFSLVDHGLVLNDIVRFSTDGALPTGLLVDTNYYVITAGLTDDVFRVSATQGGSAVNTSGTQSGTQQVIIDKIGWYDLDYYMETDREEDLYGQTADKPSKYFIQGREIIFDVPIDITESEKYRIFYDRHAHEFVVGDTTAEPGFDKQFHWILVYGAVMDWAGGKYPNIYNLCKNKIFGAGEGDPNSLKTMLEIHYSKQNRDLKYLIGRKKTNYE